MKRLLCAAICACVLVSCSSDQLPSGNVRQALVPGDGPAPSARQPPAQGALFGAFVGVGNNSEADFLFAEGIIGRKWVIDHRFYSFEDWLNGRTPWTISQNKIPLVTWEPHEPLDQIIAGRHDNNIRAKARGARDLRAEIFLRWGHEMNGNWYPWSGALNSDGARKYIAAYRHVHDLFQQEGATNVVWVWCPLVANVPDEPWNHWSQYYPGDAYVDWIGFDAYNWGDTASCCRWMSFRELIEPFYRWYASKGKPIMIPEYASAHSGGDKAAWIRTMHADLKTDFTQIKAVVWFNIWKETDWRIDSSPAVLDAYRAMAHDPYFDPG
jgi:hypothetical protein